MACPTVGSVVDTPIPPLPGRTPLATTPFRTQEGKAVLVQYDDGSIITSRFDQGRYVVTSVTRPLVAH